MSEESRAPDILKAGQRLLKKRGRFVKMGGKLVTLKTGRREPCHCCDKPPPPEVECIRYAYGPLYGGENNANDPQPPPGPIGQWCGRWESPERTILIPDVFPLPCRIAISGFVDDDIRIDGKILEEKRYAAGAQQPDGTPLDCNPAHTIAIADRLEWVMEMNKRSFKISSVDNFDTPVAPSGYSITICFGVDNPLSTWPNKENPFP